MKNVLRLMAVAAGVSVANLYYCQPLLPEIGRSLGGGASGHWLGLVPTLTQVGYALGMLFLVPLGDMIERRRMIVVMCALAAATLVAAALAPSVAVLALLSLLLGLASMVPQAVVPFAAQIAPPEQRGHAVGLVMGGLLLGILLARTVAGLVASQLGWRAVYWLAAGVMTVLAAALGRWLPASEPSFRGSYGELLRSLVELVRTQPVLRRASFLGAAAFGAFSAFWATVALRLAAPPFGYGAAVAGLFGLLGAAGALAAPRVGRLADRGGAQRTIQLALGLTAAAFVLMGAFDTSLWALGVGTVLMDLGVQSVHISNQSRIFALSDEARSRLNTVYMFSYFVGGALGSLAGGLAWEGAGWHAVTAVALVFVALGGATLHRGGARHDRRVTC